jgi:Frequency clock protein
VIDDLTIENKRLRQFLRDRRQQHDPQLDRDKVFEIRICGLSPEKKSKLGLILRDFASTIADGPSTNSNGQAHDPVVQSSTSILLSSTPRDGSSYPLADSAYASMSGSGQTSMVQTSKGRTVMQRICGSKNSNIRSYLHDIPDSLLPKHSPIMSEKSKMRMVVRRLEQLFTGKSATLGEHSQPVQQQGVSESAATADRDRSKQLNKLVHAEGAREAHILPFASKVNLELVEMKDQKIQTSRSKSSSERSSPPSTSGSRSPDQRPTRPLDLDIHRAQVAEENIDYIRHLGLSTPKFDADRDKYDDSWVYLNLLINMAQLHIFNVTPAFVRRSVSHFSTKFELSKDGCKIRWKGGPSRTELSGDSTSGADATAASSPDTHEQVYSSRRTRRGAGSENVTSKGPTLRLNSSSSRRRNVSAVAPADIRRQPVTDRARPRSEFDYEPVLLNLRAARLRTNSDEGSDQTTSLQGFDEQTGAELDSHPNNLSRTGPGYAEDDGTIFYYRNPLFYCDMSADKEHHRREAMRVQLASDRIVGVPRPHATQARFPEDNAELSSFQHEVSMRDHDDESLSAFNLAPLSQVIDQREKYVDLPASGIGGVQPDDHFILNVERKHLKVPLASLKPHSQRRETGRRAVICEEMISSNRIDLLPSRLPPASYIFFSSPSGSSTSVEGDEDYTNDPDDSEIGPADEDQPAPPAFLTRFSSSSSRPQRVTSESDDADSDFLMKLHNSTCSTNSSLSSEHAGELDRDGVVDRMVTVSLAATAGDETAASFASSRSAISSRSSNLGRRLSEEDSSDTASLSSEGESIDDVS